MKVRLGQVVGQASGSLGATVFSHNRGGTYCRLRATPTNPRTAAQDTVRAQLTTNSEAWRGLTDAQRLSWREWAQMNPIIDRLGDSRKMAGNMAYNQINCRLARAGIAPITAPPTVAAPVPLLTLSATWDIGAGNYQIVFTTTPTAANISLWILGAVVDSPGISYVENLFKMVNVTAAAFASPFDLQALTEDIFGALSVGMKVIYRVHTFSRVTGLLGAPLRVEGTVIST